MEREGTTRKLAAILSADVKEYSRLMSQDERGTIRTLTAYKEAMSKLIQEYKGRVVDAPGDNLLAEFGSVIDAVNCAVEIQRELSERNTELSYDRQMEFRIGINVGDVVEEEERLYGDCVNIAARIESLAQGGGICISGTAYDQVKDKLQFEYEPLGEQTVKNIPKPLRVYRLLSFPGAAAYRVAQAKKQEWKKWRKRASVIVLVLIVGVAAVAVWSFVLRPAPPSVEPASSERMVYPLPDKPSIAVLPFVNMSGDSEQEYFSDGITEDLITDLSQISGLFVIARNSTFVYKGRIIKTRQVAEELGVRYVLEGSVRKADKKVRINAQLIDATTGGHLWAKRYDGHLDDVFGLQDKITQRIVAALVVKLSASEQEQIERKYTDNIAAYDAFLKGRAHYVRYTPDGFAEAVRYFKKAIELDSKYGRAYAALALTYWESQHNFWNQSLGTPSYYEARMEAERYLQTAMKTPTALVYQVASRILIDSHKHEEAIAKAQRAIALDPNDANSCLAIAYALIHAGRPEEALDFVKTAMRLDPNYPANFLFVLGLALFNMEQFEEAADSFERALNRNPINYVPLIHLVAAYAHLGRKQEAAAAVQKLNKALPTVSMDFVGLPMMSRYKRSVDKDRLLDGLRKAGLPETPYDVLHKVGEK